MPTVSAEQLDIVADLNAELAPFRILTGIEVDILEDGSLDQDDELARPAGCRGGQRAFEAPDGGTGDDRPDAARRRESRTPTSSGTARVASWSDAVVPSRPSTPRPSSPPARETGTAVEINSRPERLDPPEPLLALALSLGCVVVVDTDAHAPGQLEWQRHGCEQAARAGVPVERVMNALPMDEFLAWTAGHAA